jgi:hypothetical protein
LRRGGASPTPRTHLEPLSLPLLEEQEVFWCGADVLESGLLEGAGLLGRVGDLRDVLVVAERDEFPDLSAVREILLRFDEI